MGLNRFGAKKKGPSDYRKKPRGANLARWRLQQQQQQRHTEDVRHGVIEVESHQSEADPTTPDRPPSPPVAESSPPPSPPAPAFISPPRPPVPASPPPPSPPVPVSPPPLGAQDIRGYEVSPLAGHSAALLCAPAKRRKLQHDREAYWRDRVPTGDARDHCSRSPAWQELGSSIDALPPCSDRSYLAGNDHDLTCEEVDCMLRCCIGRETQTDTAASSDVTDTPSLHDVPAQELHTGTQLHSTVRASSVSSAGQLAHETEHTLSPISPCNNTAAEPSSREFVDYETNNVTLGVEPLDLSVEEQQEEINDSLIIEPTVPSRVTKKKLGRGVTAGESVSGRRIMDPQFVFTAIKKIGYHKPFNCSFVDMDLVSESQIAGRSCFKFKCRMCNKIEKIWSEDPTDKSKMDVTSAAVLGIVSIGAGYSHLQEMYGALNMPCFSSSTFLHYQSIVAAGITAAMLQDMHEAGQEEVRLALEAGDVDPRDGIPYITVVVDGSWLKRSYRANFCSLLGSAVIISFRTKRILFVGTRSKYCMICHRAFLKKEEPRVHNCIKNWGSDQSSSGMESDIIAEGFMQSIQIHNVRYLFVIGDGDSSVYKLLLEMNPYQGRKIEKIECRNHLFRNMCNKLRDIVTLRKNGPIVLRKKIADKSKLIRKLVRDLIITVKEEGGETNAQIEKLRRGILNVPRHVFGDHSRCDDTCRPEDRTGPNIVPDLISTGLMEHIMLAMRRMADNSRSLLHDVDNSIAESANSVQAKFVAGKRVHYSKSYKTRMHAAALSFNSKRLHYKLHRVMYKCSPGSHTKKAEMWRIQNCNKTPAGPRVRKHLFHSDNPQTQACHGVNPSTPPLEGAALKDACQSILDSLKLSDTECDLFERSTIDQQGDVWHGRRRLSLTASDFGSVVSKLPSTKCDSIITQKLYTDISHKDAIIWGKTHEIDAKAALEKDLNIDILQAGYFPDKKKNYLGASPDGIVKGKRQIIETKAPYSARGKTPEEAITARDVTFWKLNKDGTVGEINKAHKWYYQVQGQLHITQMDSCIFAIWTDRAPHIKYEIIERDDNFWTTVMEKKLDDFYFDCLLPELADPMRRRRLPIRNPQYILDAHSKMLDLRKEAAAKKVETAIRRAEAAARRPAAASAACAVSNQITSGRKRTNSQTLTEDSSQINDLSVSLQNSPPTPSAPVASESRPAKLARKTALTRRVNSKNNKVANKRPIRKKKDL